jgi:hypothetical protein
MDVMQILKMKAHRCYNMLHAGTLLLFTCVVEVDLHKRIRDTAFDTDHHGEREIRALLFATRKDTRRYQTCLIPHIGREDVQMRGCLPHNLEGRNAGPNPKKVYSESLHLAAC